MSFYGDLEMIFLEDQKELLKLFLLFNWKISKKAFHKTRFIKID